MNGLVGKIGRCEQQGLKGRSQRRGRTEGVLLEEILLRRILAQAAQHPALGQAPDLIDAFQIGAESKPPGFQGFVDGLAVQPLGGSAAQGGRIDGLRHPSGRFCDGCPEPRRPFIRLRDGPDAHGAARRSRLHRDFELPDLWPVRARGKLQIPNDGLLRHACNARGGGGDFGGHRWQDGFPSAIGKDVVTQFLQVDGRRVAQTGYVGAVEADEGMQFRARTDGIDHRWRVRFLLVPAADLFKRIGGQRYPAQVAAGVENVPVDGCAGTPGGTDRVEPAGFAIGKKRVAILRRVAVQDRRHINHAGGAFAACQEGIDGGKGCCPVPGDQRQPAGKFVPSGLERVGDVGEPVVRMSLQIRAEPLQHRTQPVRCQRGEHQQVGFFPLGRTNRRPVFLDDDVGVHAPGADGGDARAPGQLASTFILQRCPRRQLPLDIEG